METVFRWVSNYGYAGLFGLLILGIVGLPVPDETLLVFSGYLIFKGRLHPLGAFLAAFSGSACGISVSYLIGRTLGYHAVLRYGKYVHITPERLDRAHAWFERVGDWLLFIGYFIPGVRHVTALVAGTSELEYQKFARFAYCGAAVWVAVFLSVGYFVGENWQTAVATVHRYLLEFAIGLAVLAACGWWIYRKKRK